MAVCFRREINNIGGTRGDCLVSFYLWPPGNLAFSEREGGRRSLTDELKQTLSFYMLGFVAEVSLSDSSTASGPPSLSEKACFD